MDYKVITDIKDLPTFLPEVPTFCDIETEHLYVGIRLVQMYQPIVSPIIYVIDCDKVNIEDVKQLLRPLWTVWQGCSYDFGCLNMTTEKFDDTLYLARTAFPEFREFGLDKLVEHFKLDKLYEGLDKKLMQKQGFVKGAYLSSAQLRYSATDVLALSLIWENERMQKTRDILAYKIDILSLKYAVEYQQNGLLVHQPSVRKELDKIVDIIADNKAKLGGLNPNSPKQVKEKLGVDGSDKATLVKLIGAGNDVAQLVYEQRRLLKRQTMLTTYNYPKVLTRFNPAGAATGRFTSTGGDIERGINAQQITRDLQYIFNQDTEDTVVIHADYSTAELRAGCSIMRDENMYKELMAGQDLHKVAAAMAMDVSVDKITKADRQKGKAISFGLIFGMSAPSFVEYAYVNYGVIFSQEEAKEIKRKYDTKYANIAKYHKERWNDYKIKPVQTPLGRRNMANLGTDAINYATQGCIAETMKLAVHYLCKDYPDAVKYIYNVVHDAAYMRVPRGLEDTWADRLGNAMKRGWQEMCKCPMLYYKDIPMPIELEYLDKLKVY